MLDLMYQVPKPEEESAKSRSTREEIVLAKESTSRLIEKLDINLESRWKVRTARFSTASAHVVVFPDM